MSKLLSDPEIERIALGLLDRSLPYAEWTHAAHFAAAIWLLRNPSILVGNGGMERTIRRYNDAVGVPNSETRGYHATITEASLRAAASFIADAGESARHSDVLDTLLGSSLGESRWLLAYWREPVLMSLEARRAWREPDVASFPFGPVPANLLHSVL